MTTRFRVEYSLKTHRRDDFIEWIKGLLAGPFTLHAGANEALFDKDAATPQKRYAEIFSDIERLIGEQLEAQNAGRPELGRLKMLVPSISLFFTPLQLTRAFYINDARRSISRRRFVSPSFNDVRLILNTAQALAVAEAGVQLVTFDGDVTLYDDGQALDGVDLPMIPRLLGLLERNITIGIVTAAGYSDHSGEQYVRRLRGLLEAVVASETLTVAQKDRVYIMGGESNFLFKLDPIACALQWIEPELWQLPHTRRWTEAQMNELLDLGQRVFEVLTTTMGLPAQIVRKSRGVGLVPLPGRSMCREELEEVVLNVQRVVETAPVAQDLEYCAFNGGSDVWLDIGNKHLGVLSLRQFVGQVPSHRTLHVGDQFASLLANDYRARQAACTVWVASPRETLNIIDELSGYVTEADSTDDR